MPRLVLIAIMISNLFGSAYAFSYLDAEHIGALCVACHNEYSFRQEGALNFSAPVKNTDVIDMYPCYKAPCHYSSNTKWGGGGNRYSLHMSEGICKNCHGKNGEFDIHKSHTKNGTTVNCNFCHASAMGWNSTHVEIPPYEEAYVARSAMLNTSIIVPNWEGDCGYCHVTLKNATRQHHVHELVLETACVDCHGKVIESVPDPIKEIVIEGGVTPEAQISFMESIMYEYYALFEDISLKLLDFYNFMRT